MISNEIALLFGFGFVNFIFSPPLLIARLNLWWMLKIVMHSPCLVSCLTFCFKKMHVQALVQLLQGVAYLQLLSPWGLDPMAAACRGAEQVTLAASALWAFQRSGSGRDCRHHLNITCFMKKIFVFNTHHVVYSLFLSLLHNVKVSIVLDLQYRTFFKCV